MKMNKYVYTAITKVGNLGLNYSAKVLPFPKSVTINGAGCRKQIPTVLKEMGVSKALIVTDQNLMSLAIGDIAKNLDDNNVKYAIYDNVCPNPTSKIAEEIRDMYLREGCNGFLAVGGGSPMDATKAAAALVVHPKASVRQLTGLFRVLVKIPPILAVPTTSGTGSETTFAAVITDSETRHKAALMDPALTPRITVMDPELVTTLSPLLTAATGMDALTHAVESYLCWTNYTKETISYAEDATAMIFKYLEDAVKNPEDVELRDKMMEASYKAGWSFGRAGVGYVHAIAHTFGGLYDVGHGIANSVILPIILEEYGPKVYGKLARLALITGVMVGGSDEEKAKAFIAEIYAMNERMGLPKGLAVKDEDIPQMVEWAMAETLITYPVPVVFDEERLTKIIKKIQSRA